MFASARRVEDIAGLEARGCRLLQLDVTDEDSMRAAVTAVETATGAVGALVNNAGYSQSGAIELVSMDDVRRQFETNVFGLARMCQLVLPGMRREHGGRIVNLSSMGGRLTFPGGGYYHATKHAVEAISDALRFEVRGFGVDVIVDRAGADPDSLRRDGCRLRRRRAERRRARMRGSRTRSRARRERSTRRDRWRGWAAVRTPSHG